MMTIQEFKAWLEGFRESIGHSPTPQQWEKILARLAEVEPDEPVQHSSGPWWPGWTWFQSPNVSPVNPLDTFTTGPIITNADEQRGVRWHA